MDASETKRIVEAAIAPMMDALAIPHYRVTVTYGPCENRNHEASCATRPEYYQASITLDPTHFDTEREVLEALRHELLHVVLADAMLLRRAMCDAEGHISEHQQAMWGYGIERMVATVEKMLHNLDADALALVSQASLPTETGGDEADAIYRERNQVAAGLARLALAQGGEAWVGADPDEPDWPVLFVSLPTGQVSWHVSPQDADLLDGIPEGDTPWDGHTTAEKYARLAGLWPPERRR